MLGISNRALVLIALNGFPDGIAVAILGIFSEALYRFFTHVGVLNEGMEFFPVLGCFAVSAVLIVLRLPGVIRIVKARRGARD